MTYGVRNKPGVSLAGLQPVMRKVIKLMAYESSKHDAFATISGGTETVNAKGVWYHSPGSLHPYGLALDFSLRDFPDDGAVRKELLVTIREQLGRDYDVILYSTHVHIEYDPK